MSKIGKRKYIFVVGSGCSGNSAVTDWLFDNLDQNEAEIFIGDFEELRRFGGAVDNVLEIDARKYINLFDLYFIVLHKLRAKLSNFLKRIKMRSGEVIQFNIRHSISRYLKSILVNRLSFYLKKYPGIRNEVNMYNFESISDKDLVVLNNPIYLNKTSFDFVKKNIKDVIFIFTYRNFEKQFEDWKRLDFSNINESKLKEISDIPDQIERFLAQQEYYLDERIRFDSQFCCYFISFDRFVLDVEYRNCIWNTLFSKQLNEKYVRFKPWQSIENTSSDTVCRNQLVNETVRVSRMESLYRDLSF
jgi:hypothetical protein